MKSCVIPLVFCAALFISPLSAAISLDFPSDQYQVKTVTVAGQSVTFRSFENIIYVSKPVDYDYQRMNIYVPEAYYHDGKVGGYTAKTAPIFLPNQVGGYMPGTSAVPGSSPFSKAETPNAVFQALEKGLVVAAPAIRGRTLKDSWGQATGKAPAFIIDYKAAVRYLRFNAAKIPGSTERIISDGTSAGGNLSALLAATGDSKDYEADLKAIGAAPGRDDIFAALVYCPVANLEYLSASYEWMFSPVTSLSTPDGVKALTQEETATASDLKTLFIPYLNSLNLKAPSGTVLTLKPDGSGSFADYLKSFVIQCLQKQLDKGGDLSSYSWVTIKNRKVVDIDFADGYVKWIGRVKMPPGWDALDLSDGENDEFGNDHVAAAHISEYSFTHSTVKGSRAAADVIKKMNVFAYIDDPSVKPAAHWRVRVGLQDGMQAMPLMLETKLANKGLDASFGLAWGQGHAGDYDLDEVFPWIASICPPEN